MLYGYNFIVHVKKDNSYKDIVKEVGKRFDTSNYELERLLSSGKNKKAIG